LRFHLEDNDEVHAEYHPALGIIDCYLSGHLTEWDLYGTEVHEELHRVIDEAVGADGLETTEKQDHWVIQRICF
jgi:hypothetical protein